MQTRFKAKVKRPNRKTINYKFVNASTMTNVLSYFLEGAEPCKVKIRN